MWDTLLFSVCSGHQRPDNISTAKVEKCHSEDSSADQLQARRRAVGTGDSSSKAHIQYITIDVGQVFTAKSIILNGLKWYLILQWNCLIVDTLWITWCVLIEKWCCHISSGFCTDFCVVRTKDSVLRRGVLISAVVAKFLPGLVWDLWLIRVCLVNSRWIFCAVIVVCHSL